MSIELKVKHKTLATEAQFIRKEERKQLGYSRYCRTTNELDWNLPYAQYLKLRDHRTQVVRPEARLTGIARGYLRGRSYSEIEIPKGPNRLSQDDCERITKMIQKYGGTDATRKGIEKWVDASAA